MTPSATAASTRCLIQGAPPPQKRTDSPCDPNFTKFTDTIKLRSLLGVKWYQNISIRLSGF